MATPRHLRFSSDSSSEEESDYEDSMAASSSEDTGVADDVGGAREEEASETVLECCGAVHRCPAGLLPVFQQMFQKVTDELMRKTEAGEETRQLTQLLLSLPVCIVGVAGQREIRRRKRLLTASADSVGSIADCVEALAPAASTPRRHQLVEDENLLPRRRIVELVEAGLAGKAVRRLEGHLQGGIVKLDDAVRAEVMQLHPEGPLGLPVGDGARTEVRVSAVDLLDTCAQAPRQSAAGVSGWTYDLVRSVVADRTCADLGARLLTCMANGRLQDAELWLRSRLVLLPKQTGGVRPLAVGEAWTRLLGRALAKRASPKAKEFLVPQQLGIAVPGGVEVAAHLVQVAAQAVQQQEAEGEDLVIQTVDFSNAFNTVNRAAIATEISTHLPELRAYVEWAYGRAAPLYVGTEHVVSATSGVRQGDPLGPLLFAMALQPVLREVTESEQRVDIVAYLDDVTLIGQREEVRAAMDRLTQLASRVGLHVNVTKSKLFEKQSAELVVVGTPVGTGDFVDRHLAETLRQQAAVLEQIALFDVKHALTMVKASVSTRPMFYARVCLPDTGTDQFAAFDGKIDETLLTLCGSSERELPGSAKLVRHLPVGLGGLGIRRLSWARSECWAASFQLALPLLRQLRCEALGAVRVSSIAYLRRIMSAAEEVAPSPVDQLESIAEPVKQRKLLARVDAEKHAELLTLAGSPVERAWIRSKSCPGSVSWLFDVMCRTKNEGMRLGLAHTLGLSVLPDVGGGFRCFCGFETASGFDLACHSLGCTKYSEIRTARHDAVRTHLASVMRKAGSGAHVLEEAALGGHQRADIRWSRGQEVVLVDVAVVSPVSPSALNKGSEQNTGIAAEEAAGMKVRQYAIALEQLNLSPTCLKPGIWECTGRAGAAATTLCTWLAEKRGESQAETLAQEGRRICAQVAHLVWDHNVRILAALVRNAARLVRS